MVTIKKFEDNLKDTKINIDFWSYNPTEVDIQEKIIENGEGVYLIDLGYNQFNYWFYFGNSFYVVENHYKMNSEEIQCWINYVKI